MKLLCALTAAALLGTAALTAQAQTKDLIDAGDIEAIAGIIRGHGTAEIGADSLGNPKITGRMGGVQYGVYFYGCTNNTDCRDIQFSSAWVNPGHVTPAVIAEWNATKRYATAYIDGEGDPVIKLPVNLYGGVSRANLDDTVDWWRIVSVSFRDDVIEK